MKYYWKNNSPIAYRKLFYAINIVWLDPHAISWIITLNEHNFGYKYYFPAYCSPNPNDPSSLAENYVY